MLPEDTRARFTGSQAVVSAWTRAIITRASALQQYDCFIIAGAGPEMANSSRRASSSPSGRPGEPATGSVPCQAFTTCNRRQT